MEYIDFCGNKISQLGLGTSSIGYEKNATQTLINAFNSGINYIDTALGYYDGLMEKYIGKWLSYYNRNSVYIATKHSIYHNIWYPNLICDEVKKQCNSLNTKYIDYFMVHEIEGYNQELFDNNWNRLTVQESIFDALDKLKHDKIVRNIGISYVGSSNNFKKIINSYNWDFVMIRDNFLDNYYHKKYLKELETPCDIAKQYRDKNPKFGIISMESFQKSILINLPYGGNIPSEHVAMKYIFKDNILSLIGSSEPNQILDIVAKYNNYKKIEDNIDDKVLEKTINNIINYIESKIYSDCMMCYKCYDCVNNYHTIWYIKKLYDEILLKNSGQSKLKSFLNTSNITCDKCNKCIVDCPTNFDIKSFITKMNNIYNNKR